MGLLSQLLWEWRPDAACPEHCGRVMGIQCLRTASGWAAGPFVLRAEGGASSEAEMSYSLEGRFATLERGRDVLCGRGSRGEPSSEAEMSYPLEGRSATLERGGDCPAGPRGTLERGGDRSAGSRGV